MKTIRSSHAGRLRARMLVCAAAWIPGCGPMISVAPTCPQELQIGDSGPVRANEVNPGAIPLYRWDVEPATAGRFTNPALNNTTFQALEAGTARLRLRAADGIYEVTAYCEVRVAGAAELAVALSALPPTATTGQTVTLSCASVGATPATTRTITQTSGPRIRLNPVSEGVVTLVPLIAGSPEFECVGRSDDGRQTPPSRLTLTVAAPGNDNDNGNDNGNNNDNGNDNGGGRR